MPAPLSAAAVQDRRVAAVLDAVHRQRRARDRARQWLVRQCRAHEARVATTVVPPADIAAVQREQQRRQRIADRVLADLLLRASGDLPSWVGLPDPPRRVLAAAAETPPPPLPAEDPTVFPGGQGGLGLNGMKLYEYEETGLDTRKFGDATSQWQDPPDLRVVVLRQFGKRDLLWDLLTAWHDPNLRVPVPQDPDEIRDLVLNGAATVDTETTEEEIPLATNIARFGDLFVDAFRAGVKLRFTFLTLGLGSSRLVSLPDTGEGGAVEGVATTYLDPIADDAWHPLITQRLAMRLYWTDDFAIEEPGEYAEVVDHWSRAALDLYDDDKRLAIWHMARACAELLVRAADNARSKLTPDEAAGFDLAQVFDGVELFNEVDARNVVADIAYHDWDDPAWVGTASAGHWDPQAHGHAWGRLWADAALGLLWGFRELRLAGTWTPPSPDWAPTLYLPGVSSYAEQDNVEGEYNDAVDQDFWYKHDFLDALISAADERWTRVRDLLSVSATTTGWDLDRMVPPLADVVGGVDYHWYHGEPPKPTGTDKKTGTAPLGPLPGLWLAMEVQALSDLLLSHGLDGSVTVFETGVGTQDVTSTYLPPSNAVGPTDKGVGPLELHQANEVFRRLLFAAVGGADQVGWHTWMSLGGGFAAYGLRVDIGESYREASASSAKASFFAMSRLSVFFRDATTIRLLQPDRLPARTRDQLLRTTDGTIAGSGAVDIPTTWVFEIQGATFGTIGGRDLSAHPVAYVVMSDPTLGGADPVTVRFGTGGTTADPQPVQIQALPVMPTSTWQEPISGDPEVTLPRYELEASLPGAVDLARDGADRWRLESPHRCMPVIVAARGLLTVEI